MLQSSFCFSSNTDKHISKKSTKSELAISFTGSHLQHHFFDEMLSVIDIAISFDMIEDLQKVLIDLANASLASNKTGDLILTSFTLDACWAIIDFTKKIRSVCTSEVNVFLINMMLGNFNQLSYKSVAVQSNLNEVIKDVVTSFAVMGYYLGKVIHRTVQHKAMRDLLKVDQKRLEQFLKKLLIDPILFFAVYDECIKKDFKKDILLSDKECAVHTILLHGIIKLVSLVNKKNLPIFLSCIHEGIQSCENEEANRNICAEEINVLLGKMQKIMNLLILNDISFNKIIFLAIFKMNISKLF
jgi:hypothetical protein